jgi:hypothetical protein
MNYENLKYSITEYHDLLINKLDIIIETEIDKVIRSEKENQVKLGYLNKLRDDFISEIKLIQKENLKEYELNSASIQFLLNKVVKTQGSQNEERLIEEIKKEFVFKKFCFLVLNAKKNLVYLVSCDVYFNLNEIEYFK